MRPLRIAGIEMDSRSIREMEVSIGAQHAHLSVRFGNKSYSGGIDSTNMDEVRALLRYMLEWCEPQEEDREE